MHNGGPAFAACLEALATSTLRPLEVLVVDDGSTDDSAAVAQRAGARAIPVSDGPRGPAYARNRGAEAAGGDGLVFLDADVAVHPDALTGFVEVFEREPGVAAIFGSYDDRPPASGLVSRYKNLQHHYVHQTGRREAGTFWAGCGAIRREVFQALGGFDEGYTRASIELGTRLRRAGYRILLVPGIQATHLKRWTFRGLLRSDLFDRAIPWTRLILRGDHLPTDLNLDVRSRLSALVVWTALLFLMLGLLLPWAWRVTVLAVGALCTGSSRDAAGFGSRPARWAYMRCTCSTAASPLR